MITTQTTKNHTTTPTEVETPLHQLSRLSTVSDDILIAITTGWKPAHSDTVRLALAVLHERNGDHASGCDVCNLNEVNQLAIDLLYRHFRGER